MRKIYKKQQAQRSKLTRFLFESNISFISITIVSAALVVLGIFLSLGGKIFSGNIPEYYFGISGIFFLLLLGCCGLLQILRDETPGPLGQPVDGLWAKVTGWILLLIPWGLAAYFLVYTILIWPN